MSGLHLSVVIVVTWAALTMAQVKDPTRQEGGKGPEVVEAVVRLIRQSCVFPDDHLLLRRIAFVETNDGLDPNTYRSGFHGGIWGVSETVFRNTQNDPNLDKFYADITQRFGINWNTMSWDELRKPICSGLATALTIAKDYNGQPIPFSKEDQGAWYQSNIHPQDNAANNFYNKSKFIKSSESNGKCRPNSIDLAFVVDTSSLSTEDFNISKSFATKFVDFFNIAPDSMQIAFMTFNTDAQMQFDFNDYRTKEAVKNAIGGMVRKSCDTTTDKALDIAASELFTPTHGVRSTSAKVAVLLTDGKAGKRSSAVRISKKLKELGVTVFVIGVGDEVERSELESLASDPVCTHVYQLEEYRDLDLILSDIRQMNCEAGKCGAKNIDLAFVVDTSSSLSEEDFKSSKTFASNIVDFFNIAPDSIQVAFLTFSSDVQMQFDFNKYPSKAAVKKAIEDVVKKPGKTATDKALDFAASQLFTAARGVRPNSAKVAVLLTDGNADNRAGAVSNSQKLKDLGVTLFVIGVGEVDRNELESLASKPVSTHVQQLTNYRDLYLILSDIRQMSCEAPVLSSILPPVTVPTNPPVTLPASTAAPPPPPNPNSPCTYGLKTGDLFYHPYPNDRTKFIQCDQFGKSFIKDCPKGLIWSQDALTCNFPRPGVLLSDRPRRSF